MRVLGTLVLCALALLLVATASSGVTLTFEDYDGPTTLPGPGCPYPIGDYYASSLGVHFDGPAIYTLTEEDGTSNKVAALGIFSRPCVVGLEDSDPTSANRRGFITFDNPTNVQFDVTFEAGGAPSERFATFSAYNTQGDVMHYETITIPAGVQTTTKRTINILNPVVKIQVVFYTYLSDHIYMDNLVFGRGACSAVWQCQQQGFVYSFTTCTEGQCLCREGCWDGSSDNGCLPFTGPQCANCAGLTHWENGKPECLRSGSCRYDWHCSTLGDMKCVGGSLTTVGSCEVQTRFNAEGL